MSVCDAAVRVARRPRTVRAGGHYVAALLPRGRQHVRRSSRYGPELVARNRDMYLKLLLLITVVSSSPLKDARREPDAKREVFELIYVNRAEYLYPVHPTSETNTPVRSATLGHARTRERRPVKSQSDANKIKITFSNNSVTDYVITNDALDDCTAQNNKTALKINCNKANGRDLENGKRRTVLNFVPKVSKNVGDNDVSDDKWVWGYAEQTTVSQTHSTVDLDDRAAFNGDKCPKGKVRIANKCIEEE